MIEIASDNKIVIIRFDFLYLLDSKYGKKELPLNIIKEHKNYYDGSIAVCDDCGVVIIPKEFHTEEFFDKIQNIEKQEDIWFERLDRYKENTFEIVCLKKYLKEE